MPELPQQHARAKTQDTTTLSNSRYVPSLTKSSPSRYSTGFDKTVPATYKPQRSKQVGLSSSKKSAQSSAKTKPPNQVKPRDEGIFFFRLTEEELAKFRRKNRKGPTYEGFGDVAIAQELNRLGRGWEGYCRSRLEAEEEGKLDEFQQRFQTEHMFMSTGISLPVGAISMQAAMDAARADDNSASKMTGKLYGNDKIKVNGSKELSMTTVNLQQEPRADLETSSAATGNQDREDPYAMPASPEPESVDFELLPSDSTDDYQPPESTTMSKADSPDRHKGRPKGSKNNTISLSTVVDRPRPKRVETRPDYRIRRIRERHPRPYLPPRPPSPTPRDLYDQSQPRFLQFKCEWAGCKALLNNTANVRKHVGIVHGQEARDTLCCNWGKCGRDDSTGVLSIFGCIEDLEVHLQTLHMESMKWHLGDGRLGRGLVVKGSGMGDTSYLYSNGKQVTPSITKQRTETLAEWRARKERLKEILLKTAMNARSDSELEVLGGDEDSHESVLL